MPYPYSHQLYISEIGSKPIPDHIVGPVPHRRPICWRNCKACKLKKYEILEFQVAHTHTPEILGPAGSFSCKLMVTEGHVTFELWKDNITR